MPVLPTPDDEAARLDGISETGAAALIRAMAAELAAVRAERDRLAQFARQVAHLQGDGLSHNCRLIGQAHEALDTLRVTRRCPKPVCENGRHYWMRDSGAGSRCFSCSALRPTT